MWQHLLSDEVISTNSAGKLAAGDLLTHHEHPEGTSALYYQNYSQNACTWYQPSHAHDAQLC